MVGVVGLVFEVERLRPVRNRLPQLALARFVFVFKLGSGAVPNLLGGVVRLLDERARLVLRGLDLFLKKANPLLPRRDIRLGALDVVLPFLDQLQIGRALLHQIIRNAGVSATGLSTGKGGVSATGDLSGSNSGVLSWARDRLGRTGGRNAGLPPSTRIDGLVDGAEASAGGTGFSRIVIGPVTVEGGGSGGAALGGRGAGLLTGSDPVWINGATLSSAADSGNAGRFETTMEGLSSLRGSPRKVG